MSHDFIDEKIVDILIEVETSGNLSNICRRHDINLGDIHKWKSDLQGVGLDVMYPASDNWDREAGLNLLSGGGREVPTMSGIILTEISVGELVDKITILRIKMEKISDEKKRENIHRELNALLFAYKGANIRREMLIVLLEMKLLFINKRIWDSEDAVRVEMRKESFGAEFVAATKASHQANEERAMVKKMINQITKSRLIEEKSY